MIIYSERIILKIYSNEVKRTVFFRRLYTNKYVFKIHGIIYKTVKYGLKNAVRLSSGKECDYDRLKNIFANKNGEYITLLDKKLQGKHYINTLYDFGYCTVGPLIYDFIKWINNNSREYDRLWFLSREGWLLKKVYDIYCKKNSLENKGEYFLSSRRAASLACVKNSEDIREILMQYYKGSLKNLINIRLGVSVSEDFYVEMPEDIERAMKYINVDEVIKKAETSRKNYMEYIGRTEGSIAVVDVGYMGTIQYYLSRLLDKKIGGFYLCSHYKNKPHKIGCSCKSMYPVIDMGDEGNNLIFKNQMYLEAILKAPYGQLVEFRNKEAVYDNDMSYDMSVEEIQRGILDFVYDAENNDTKINTFSVELFDYGVNNAVSENVIHTLKVNDKYCSNGIQQYDTESRTWRAIE